MTIPSYSSPTSSYTATGPYSNVNYKPWLGNVDAVTGKPNLGVYGYFIGKLPYNTGYTIPSQGSASERALSLHFPGPVRFARTGLASLAAGKQYLSASGRKFISGGPVGDGQGFAISA